MQAIRDELIRDLQRVNEDISLLQQQLARYPTVYVRPLKYLGSRFVFLLGQTLGIGAVPEAASTITNPLTINWDRIAVDWNAVLYVQYRYNNERSNINTLPAEGLLAAWKAWGADIGNTFFSYYDRLDRKILRPFMNSIGNAKTIMGIASMVAAFAVTNPVGWALIGAAVGVAIISLVWLYFQSKSYRATRERLKSEKSTLTTKLEENLSVKASLKASIQMLQEDLAPDNPLPWKAVRFTQAVADYRAAIMQDILAKPAASPDQSTHVALPA